MYNDEYPGAQFVDSRSLVLMTLLNVSFTLTRNEVIAPLLYSTVKN